MGHTNTTPNLNLPQFVGSDKPTWLSDVNGAMLAIDTAYGTIEAQASSAATAAAGAVTTAGAAQTAAESAASAAATAGSNASEALSTANNAATIALQAKNDADEALEIGGGKVIATVTADGVKTYKQLLNELFAAITPSEVTPHSVLDVAGVMHSISLTASSYAFGSIPSGNGVEIQARQAVVDASNSVYMLVAIGSSTSVTDLSASVLTDGRVIKLYK